MAKWVINDSTLTSIADAVRAKLGTSDPILVSNIATAIASIPYTPPTPVPTGTWQLKTTSGKKYIIIGTDDDNAGNTKFFRLLRTYGFPYTMNVEAETASKNPPQNLGSDVDTTIFDENDAPSIFPTDTDVVTLGQYLRTSGLGEVAQHGSSGKVLWDSTELTGSKLDAIYSTYTTGGGQKTKEELKAVIMSQLADTDVAQGATYVQTARATLQSIYGFPINTVGIWGGKPDITVDGVYLDLTSVKGWSNYPWRTNGYKAASTILGNGVHSNSTPYNISRQLDETQADAIAHLNQIPYGHAHEFFWHQPFSDIGNTALRGLFDAIAAEITAGKAEVVTRSQYEALGEYVQNPVVSISATRADITVGDTDTKSAYHVTATYADNTTADVSSEAVVWNDTVDTSTEGVYSVPVTYRGKNVILSVVVTSGGSQSVNLHFTHTGRINANNGEYYTNSSSTDYFASSELVEYDSSKTYYVTFSGTASNNGTRPKLQEMFCYDSSGVYLGYFGLSGLQGKITDMALPDPTETYPTTAKFRIQGRVNASYSTTQVQDWSCHADS